MTLPQTAGRSRPAPARSASSPPTHYTGEYSVDGGTTWLPVVGEAQVDSSPFAVEALAGHIVLVAEPLAP